MQVNYDESLEEKYGVEIENRAIAPLHLDTKLFQV